MRIYSASSVFSGAVLLLTVTACGESNKSAAPPPETAVVATTSAAQPTAPPPAPSAAAPAATVNFVSLTGDAAKGEKVFTQCKTCHVAEQGVNRIGPSLWGVVGRPAGSIEGFKYSDANKNSGLTWTDEQLYTYLEAPRKVVPGTTMSFAGLKKPQDRADVIAYLKTKA